MIVKLARRSKLVQTQLWVEVDKLETARIQLAGEYSQGLTQESLILERQWKEMRDYLKGIKFFSELDKRGQCYL